MEQIIVDDNKIRCLITEKLRPETPEEHVRQEFCRLLLDVYNYPKERIDLEFPIKIGIQTKRADIVVFNSEMKTQSNVYIIIETKKRQETEGIEREYLEMYSPKCNWNGIFIR